MDGNVSMALEADEKTLVENALTLLQQLMDMQEGGVTPEVMEAMPPDMEIDEGQIEKAVLNETGDTKAEDRLANQTELTDQGISELKKTMSRLEAVIGKKKAVEKAKADNALLAELKKLNSRFESVEKAISEQDAFNHTLMKAFSFSDEMVTKTIEQEKSVQKSKPYQSQDVAVFVKDLIAEVFKNLPQQQQTQVNPDYQHPFNQKRRLTAVGKSDQRKPIHNVIDFICKKGVA